MSQSYFFFDDYSEGAHPQILEALVRTNLQQERGYVVDSFAQEAETLIKKIIHQPEAHIHFVAGGTLANLVCLASMLKPYESVIAADHGHIAVHEAGAIEATGHKINTIPCADGKLTSKAILDMVELHTDEHMVKPRVVYISQLTELGTLYTKQELHALYQTCQQLGLYLYIDGARLGHALMSHYADFDLRDIAANCDMFYIGGTKNGALLGEAIVIVNPTLQENFRHHLRQRGALLAKARTVTIQFIEFFKDQLYFTSAKHANVMAQKLAIGIKACGYNFINEPCANQIFPILPDTIIEHLKKKYGFYFWEKATQADHSVIRLVTSWATTETAVKDFINDLKIMSEPL